MSASATAVRYDELSRSATPFRPIVAVHRLTEVRRWSAYQWPAGRPLISIVPDIEIDTELDRLSPHWSRNRESASPAPPGPAELSGLLRLVLEVLDRRRPERQLEDWLPVGERRMLLQEAETGPAGRWRLRSLRPSVPVPGVLELCATVQVGSRTRAMVGRFECAGREWHCALLRMV